MLPPKLPAHARIITNDQVWLETTAVEQLARSALRDDCCDAVGMPDMHPGPNSPIGVVLSFGSTIIPSLIGGDAGCGARFVATKSKKINIDKVERRLKHTEDAAWRSQVDPYELLTAAWREGVPGLAHVSGMPDSIRALAASEGEPCPPTHEIAPPPDWLEPHFGRQLGTVGGGNHFLEITRVADTIDDDRARSLGIRRGQVCVLTHTGSRAMGQRFAQQWHGQSLTCPTQHGEYMRQLHGTLRYSAVNRFLCSYGALEALGELRPERQLCTIDLSHNDVQRQVIAGRALWVHRKGAAPALAQTPSLLLGSRGTASWVLWGLGCDASAHSIAHGAGRKLTRARAREQVRHKYARASLTRTALGGRVVCDDVDLLREEHPDAYKAVEPVVAALESAGAAQRVAALHPLMTIKR